MVSINPIDPENGKGIVQIWNLDEYENPKKVILEKEFSINVNSEFESIIIEGEIWFKKNKEVLIKELKEKGYKEINFRLM